MKKISIITLVLITLFLTGFCFFCSAQNWEQIRPMMLYIDTLKNGKYDTVYVHAGGRYFNGRKLNDNEEIHYIGRDSGIYSESPRIIWHKSYKGKWVEISESEFNKLYHK